MKRIDTLSQKFDTPCKLRDHPIHTRISVNNYSLPCLTIDNPADVLVYISSVAMKNYQLNNITLHTLNASSTTGILSFGHQTLPCSLGRGGITSNKHEGDRATPRGKWPLLWVYYRPDRLRRPKTSLPAYPLTPDMGWCDEPIDANYNQPVPWPYKSSAEQLWREDHIYDLIVVLGYNLAPCRKGRGSAIFWHLAHNNFSPTAGCVAIWKKEMLKLLERCGPETRLIVG